MDRKTIVSLIVLGFFLIGSYFAGPVYAVDSENGFDQSPPQDYFHFVLHLYYDQGLITANKTSKNPFDVAVGEFVPETLSTTKPYRGDIISVNGHLVNTFQFDPRKGETKFTKGAIEVGAPYATSAKTINFYSDKNELLLAMDLGDVTVCNEDQICEVNNGEDTSNCPVDCGASVTPTPLNSISPSSTGEPTVTPQPRSKWKIFFPLVIWFGLAIVLVVVWAIIKRRKPY